jgi:hypothetical protein
MSSLAKIDAEINYILSLIKQIPKFSKTISIKTKTSSSENNKNKNAISLLSTRKTKNVSNNSPLILEDNQSDLLRSENFPFSHMCNRDVDHLYFIYI